MKLKINALIIGALFAAFGFVTAIAAQEKPARDEKIVFRTATLSKAGTLRGRDFHDFTFSAKAGQNLTLTLVSRQNVNFNLLDKKTMTLVEIDPSPMQVADWAGTLPKTGDYVIRVFILPRTGPRNRTASYRLAIAISDGARSETSGAAEIETTANYICEPNAELRADFYKNRTARIRYGTQDFMLEQTASGSGARYENKKERVLFWVKGREATLDSKVLSGICRQQ